MPTTEERMRILRMIAAKQITAEEGARLLEALRSDERAGSSESSGRPRSLRVKVTNRNNGRVKLNVTIPVALVDVAIKMGASFAPGMKGTDTGAIQAAIRQGVQGRIFSLDDDDDEERVEIFVE